MSQTTAIDPAEIAHVAVDVASDKQASDIVLLDIRDLSDFADYFVILTAESSRQMRTLSDDLEEAVENAGGSLHHREGTHQSGWMLLDFGDLIVHMFGPEERDYYRLEEAWSDASEIVRIQ